MNTTDDKVVESGDDNKTADAELPEKTEKIIEDQPEKKDDEPEKPKEEVSGEEKADEPEKAADTTVEGGEQEVTEKEGKKKSTIKDKIKKTFSMRTTNFMKRKAPKDAANATEEGEEKKAEGETEETASVEAKVDEATESAPVEDKKEDVVAEVEPEAAKSEEITEKVEESSTVEEKKSEE